MSAISSAQIRALQATRRAAGIDDDTWKATLRSRFQVASTRDLTARDADSLLADLRCDRADPMAGPYGTKARALWISAWQLGLVGDRCDAALLAFVTRQTGLQALVWLRDPAHGRAVIEALKAWLARDGGVDWSAHPAMPIRAVAEVLLRRHDADGSLLARLQAEELGADPSGWTQRDWQLVCHAAATRSGTR